MTLKELVAQNGPVIPRYWECLGSWNVGGVFDGCGAVYLEPRSCLNCGKTTIALSYYHGNETNSNPIYRLPRVLE